MVKAPSSPRSSPSRSPKSRLTSWQPPLGNAPIAENYAGGETTAWWRRDTNPQCATPQTPQLAASCRRLTMLESDAGRHQFTHRISRETLLLLGLTRLGCDALGAPC